MTENTRGRKSRIITCPYCKGRFSLHSKRRTPLQKMQARSYARRKRTTKKLTNAIVKSLVR